MLKNEDKKQLSDCLQECGCCCEKIDDILELLENDKEDALNALENHRDGLLEELHQDQKKIDCLDYLIWKLKK